jgi:molecular chaperone HtpG
MSTTAERHSFQAETRELLDLMIHAIYSNKDIFLRELISNASDAIDKLKFESLTQSDLPKSDDPQILLATNREARTLTIEDNGIGMSHDEVVKLIGTIAKSGTREFMSALKTSQTQDGVVPPELIGQFGVGFYSTFMVADKVILETRKAGETHGTRWESGGDGTYTIAPAERATHGTSITLHLKTEDAEDGLHDYTAEWTLKEIVKKYSDFVAYPIRMDVEHTEYERDSDGKIVEGTAKTSLQRETLNSMKAIWARPESDVTDEEYQEFYRHISHDWHDAMAWFRTKMEGMFEAQALLFIPDKAPTDLFYREGKRGIQLYVKRVFIMDNCKELMPDYLRFIKGVVDSEDLSLNISREILQQNRQIRAIRNRLVKKILGTLEEMQQQDREKYLKFWGEFGRVLKEGLYEDYDNRDALLNLGLFATTHYEGDLTTLKDYVSRMKSGQDKVYYATAEDRKTIENSPHLEAFREKGYEVLLLTDAVDEIWTQSISEFSGCPLQAIGKGTVELGTEAEKKEAEKHLEAKEKEYHSLLGAMHGRLSDYIKEVRLSNRLTNSLSCLVGGQTDLSPQMEQMLKAMNQPVPENKRVLELNPNHPLMQKLQQLFAVNQSDPALNDYAYMLYGQALLAEGSPLPDPAKFSRLVTDLLAKAI